MLTRFWTFSLMFVLFPFLGGLWRKRGIVVASLLGSAGLLIAGVLSPSETSRFAIFSQIIVVFALGFALHRITDRQENNKNITLSKAALDSADALREKYKTLKDLVSRGDQEESRSLQIYGIAKGLAESLSWKEMAPRLFSGLQKLFGAYEFLLYSIDENRNWSLLQRRGNWAKEPPLSTVPPSETAVLFPPQVREPVPVLSIPVFSASGTEALSGFLFLKSSDKELSHEELIVRGREFGEQLGVALKKALLFNQMEIHSRIDGLTGVLRRQPFMDRLNEELKRAGVFHTPFSLMMVDIDHFKTVNDTHGHAAGDAVLSRVGQILKESVYETDVVGRYGGEEFIVLLPRADAVGVLRKAEALRRRFETEMIPFGFENLKITVSIGLAHFPEGGKTADALISSTDKALYRAKETGRNKVVAA